MPDFKKTLKEIKSRGYWHVHAYPNSISTSKLAVSTLKEIVRNAAIQLRGWDYPHFPTQNDEKQALYTKGEAIEAWINWEQYKEVWRLHDTGQFIHLFGLREDWWELNSWLDPTHPLRQIPPGSVLEIISTTMSVTEMYLYFKNLAEKGFYDDGLVVEIRLSNVMKRKLHVSDPMRAPLFMSYPSMVDEIQLPKRVYNKEDILNRYLELALEQIIYIYNQFNWDNPPVEVLKQDQKKLLERRI